MSKAVRQLVFAYLLFILFLSVAGFFDGVLGEIIYFLAFLLPIAFVIVLNKGFSEFCLPKIRISKRDLLLTFPTIAPIILVILGISAFVSFLFSLFGIYNESTVDLSGNILIVILRHAFLTAVCEELLFRYLPIALLSKYSPKLTVLLSSIFFAFAHCNVFQIPYALFAGCVFCVLDIIFGSVTPSLILHFINNLLSVFWMKYGGVPNFKPIYIISLAVISLISILVLILMWEKYKDSALRFIEDKTKLHLQAEVWVFIVMTALISLISI